MPEKIVLNPRDSDLKIYRFTSLQDGNSKICLRFPVDTRDFLKVWPTLMTEEEINIEITIDRSRLEEI